MGGLPFPEGHHIFWSQDIREIKLLLTYELPPWWPAFTVPKGTVVPCRLLEGEVITVSDSHDPTPAIYSNSDLGQGVPLGTNGMNIMG